MEARRQTWCWRSSRESYILHSQQEVVYLTRCDLSIYETSRPTSTVTYFLQQDHSYSNKAILPSSTTPFGVHFLSNHHSSLLKTIFQINAINLRISPVSVILIPQSCDSLSEILPDSLRHLNTWPSVIGTVWGKLDRYILAGESISQVDALRVNRLMSFLVSSLCFVLILEDVSRQLLLQPPWLPTMLLVYSHFYGNVSPNKLCKVSWPCCFITAISCNTQEVITALYQWQTLGEYLINCFLSVTISVNAYLIF